MGCKTNHIGEVDVAYHKDIIYVILPNTNKILEGYIIKKDVSSLNVYKDYYIVSVIPNKGNGVFAKNAAIEYSLPIQCLFSDYNSACRELTSCDVEEKLEKDGGTLIANALGNLREDRNTLKKVFLRWWNRLIKKLIINGY